MTSKTFSHKQTRREFCTHACHVASLATLVATADAVASGCSSPTDFSNLPALPILSATESNGTVSLAVDASSPLAAVGSAALVQTQSRYLLVARTGADTFDALTAICTHQRCIIDRYTNQTYVCPCHGSRFNLNGGVLAGPAAFSLSEYTSQFADDQLTISL